ncbi:hypothetical protein [Agromyces seonyuensis]|uniref:Uncharacterized protein n=1 Tax=Agromyces seonyuensis TaxID=2662446 RepID=A0A6I4NWZ5_9MICO|nr:hypothetical protein [Agromyces seonyuensis]MWB98701.1 hypothetical protein [Agromyces seonyuensis]
MNRAAAVAIGAVSGLAWAAALRAWMSEIAGILSTFSWGTFVAVLLPGLLIGASFGWAWTVPPDTSPSTRRGLRWCAAAPVLFAVFPLLRPGALVDFLTSGLGGGAFMVAGLALAGGYALGGRRTWARWVCGVLALGFIAIGALFVGPLLGGDRLALTDPEGAWVAVLDVSLLVVLCLASSIPFRRLAASADPERPAAAPASTAQVDARSAGE